MESDIEPLKYQKWVLKVLIHCHGCKEKVKKILHKIEGVYKTMVDPNQHRVTVIGDIDVEVLIKKLAKNGKRAEIWSETPQPTKEKVKNKKKEGQKVEEKEKLKKKTGNDHTSNSITKPPKSKDNKTKLENQTPVEASDVSKPEEKRSGSKKEETSEETDGVTGEATGDAMAVVQKQKKKKQKEQFTSLVILPPPVCGLSYSTVLYPNSGYYVYYTTSPVTPVTIPAAATEDHRPYIPPMTAVYYGQHHHQIPAHCCVYSNGCRSSVFSDDSVAGCHVM